MTVPSESSRAAAAAHVGREEAELRDLAHGYPANHVAYPAILDRLERLGARRVVEVGVGDGNAIPMLTAAGIEVTGFDIDADRVSRSRERMAQFGQDSERVFRADIADPSTYADIVGQHGFDALIAFGILPHVADEVSTLSNMLALVRPGGEVFVECRNKLFSLVTFNRYTYEFILDDLLGDTPESLRVDTAEFLSARVDVDVPPRPTGRPPTFHNPFEVPALFQRAGFVDVDVVPFHYHASMPMLERQQPQAFRDASLALEGEASGWRGLFLCSAFLVRARRPEPPR